MEAASSQMTLLYAAARGYDAQVAQLVNRKSINERDDMGNTPLHLAASAGHVATVKTLLKADGVDVNAQNNLGKTPLHQAVWRSHTDIIRLLLAMQARADVKDKDGHIAKDLARNKEIKDMLPNDADEDDMWGELSGSDSD